MIYLFERDAEFDVVFSGRESLLPDRATIEDGRMTVLARYYSEIQLPKERYVEDRRTKRQYNKINLTFWNQWSLSTVRSGPARGVGQATVEGTRLPRDQQKHLSHPPPHQKRTT